MISIYLGSMNRGRISGKPISGICENCGEYYLSDHMTSQVLERVEAAVKNGAEVEILRFAA